MPHDILKFVHDRGNMTDKANSLFCEFAQFLSAQPGITINIWKNTFNWLQHELSNQVGACNKPRHMAHIRRLKLVEDEAQSIKISISELEKVNENGDMVYFDMQSQLESDMSDDKKMMAVKAMLNNDKTLK